MNTAKTERKDIYFDGKVYQDVEDVTALIFYDSFDLIGSYSFKDGQPVIEGKDYELQFRVLYSYPAGNTVIRYTRPYPSEEADRLKAEVDQMIEKGTYRYDIVAIPLDNKEEGEIEAVKFAEWISDNQFTRYNNIWASTKIHYHPDQYTTKELYDIFKTQNH